MGSERIQLTRSAGSNVVPAARLGVLPSGPVGAMRIERLEAMVLELPFRFSFGHALATRASSCNVIVAVHLDDGTIGYGEGVPRDYVTGETTGGAHGRVTDVYGPALVGTSLPTTRVAEAIRTLRDDLHADGSAPGAAWCAVETALLDAAGKRLGLRAEALLGGQARSRVRYSGVVPFAHGPALFGILAFFRLYGVRDVKLKVGRGEAADVSTARLARRVLGPGITLRADANCAWTADEALAMAARLRQFGIRAYEQPVPADDLDGLRRLTADLPEDVVVDESLRSVDDARRLAEMRACTAFNIRVSKCGGPLAALEIVEIARRAGLTCQLGAQVGESGILSAAGRLVATVARPGFRWLEGSDNRFLLRSDLTAEDLTIRPGGWGAPLDRPGLGVRVPRARVLALGRRRVTLDAAAASRSRLLSLVEG
ncbi:MAG: dipeptide epimerase [Chloroflexi bacterium]|nr:dipeptide epimerase [Chloroflexota bacterium]